MSKLFCIVFMFVFLILMLAISDTFPYSNSEVLKKAEPYLPTLKNIIQEYWKDVPMKETIPAQIEAESGWKVNAELRTSREHGVGFSQITIAFNKDGSVRFDNFKEAKRKYKELTDWNWNDKFNAKYHFTYLCLTDKSNFNNMSKLFTKNIDRWAGTLVSYNAGRGTVLNRRALCKITEGCNFNLWFGGCNTVKMKGEDKLLYGQKLYEMRNKYPFNIIFKKSEKYKNAI
jgi:hypothetical protein